MARHQLDLDRIAAGLPGYELGDELGRGGFGVVVAARHRLIDRPVAVKVLTTADLDPAGGSGGHGSGGRDLRARFLDEARVLAGLDHPHVVRIYDYVETDGLCLLVMEQLTGGSLRGRALAGPGAASAIGVAAAVALDAAHGRGVLHRDIKPDNLLFTADGTPKVTDFGIAKIVEATAATTTGLVGTPRYMAPEQITGSPLSPATDLYALGVVLYELFAGRSPFPPELPVAALLHHHLSVRPLPMPEAPGPIAEIIIAALAKEAGWRPASGLDFAVRLAAATTAAYGPGWLSASGVPVRLPDEVLSAAGHQPGISSGPGAVHGGGRPAGVAGPPAPTVRAGRRRRPAGGGQPAGGRRVALTVGASLVVAGLAVALVLKTVVLGGDDQDNRQAAYAGRTVQFQGLADAAGIALGPDGALYVSDPGDEVGQGQIVRLSAAGQAGLIGGSGPRPTPTGNVPSPSPTPVLGDGGQSLRAELREPAGLAIGPDGAVYLAESDNGRVRRIARDATITTVAGTSRSSSDGSVASTGAALRAYLDDPTGLTVDAKGVIYVTDGYRVRRIEGGQISTVAGSGTESGSAGDGGPAINATFYQPSGLAIAPNGVLYIADRGNDTVRRVDRSGTVSLVAGSPGKSGRTGDGRAASSALLNSPKGLALGADGSLYIADSGNDVVRRIDPHGIISTVAGSASYSSDDQEGALATQVSLSGPAGVVVDPSGALYVACGDGSIRRVSTDMFLTTVLRGPPDS
ncbi:protein kinase [Frankia sp. Ag45/Mut15]|uniref:non-specific serine/threonine protein kinase n=1 Tax=Frankia umida TaxID=573489 RepID=A0ABT0JUE3_9ACTN|nr:serine/threonine-protein kinase [Frankia umida]MCK9875076.1 protein kinase [Frankia umida]